MPPTPEGRECRYVRVALDVPLPGLFDYCSAQAVEIGQRVIVPFGRRDLVGMVVDLPAAPAVAVEHVKAVSMVLDDLPAMPGDWLAMVDFAARYYQRPLGEVIMPALPPPLRKAGAYTGQRAAGGPVRRLERRLEKQRKRLERLAEQPGKSPDEPPEKCDPDSAASGHPGLGPAPAGGVNGSDSVPAIQAPSLNDEQRQAVAAIAAVEGHGVVLLRGITGSGKTEVYLHAAQRVLAGGRQVLFLVPEINLTPQLERALRARFDASGADAAGTLAVLHSGMSDGERLEAWLRAFRGEARVLLGTRMAITAPLPRLGLIIVDEEHDASYKQQDGLRYSARDLAVWRGHDRGVPVVLGSATPSLESWNHAMQGRYLRVSLTRRAREVALPAVRMVDTRRLKLEQGFSPQLLDAMERRLALQEQVLVFINRRGYAPVLSCTSCGWVSQCSRCTAYSVLHRLRGRAARLQCHHCGGQAPVPRACPDCGDLDLKPMGRGTQRIEEFLGERFPEARIARIDADSTRLKGSAAALFSQVHQGEVDILVGTQMVAKGHDFANLGLVGVLNADSMLFAQDFRAPERLFAQLMQVAGRAGRHRVGGEVMLQTDYPDQPVYRALQRHDYEGFAQYALDERKVLGLPPYSYQALLVAEGRELAHALQFLNDVRKLPEEDAGAYPMLGHIMLYDPVPLRVVRVANIERAQLLVESHSRPALQRFLAQWSEDLFRLGRESRVRYSLEVDPFEI
ncbi:primosomal protein N' [Alcaligenaceae bacterium]|nr:primosomal protein N' [Alcaligenaceae bacterium]